MNDLHEVKMWLALAPVLAPLGTAAALAVMVAVGRRPTESLTVRLTEAALWTSLTSSIIMALMVVVQGPLQLAFRHWFDSGAYHVSLGFHVHAPAAAMLVMTAAFVGVITRFSRNYLHRDPGFVRFFATMNMAAGAMSLLLMAGNLELMFVGWELLGVSSALLVGFFQERRGPVHNALRVFVVYRVADVGLLLAGVLLHAAHVSTEFATWTSSTLSAAPAVGTVVALCLLWAAAGKSAQLPFSSWLPRAMEGPTPSSAMFYGALSIHAGAYLLLRAAPLIAGSAVAQLVVVLTGAVTALHAHLVFRTQTDVKSRLAYASLGHIGVIVVLVGVGQDVLAGIWMVAHALLRGAQLLRSPSALSDAALEFNLASTRSRSRLPGWLYRAALERFYFDTLIDRFVVGGFNRLSYSVDAFDRLVTGRAPAFGTRVAPVGVYATSGELRSANRAARRIGGLGLLVSVGMAMLATLSGWYTHALPLTSLTLATLAAGAAAVPFARDRPQAYRWMATSTILAAGLLIAPSWWVLRGQSAWNEWPIGVGPATVFHVDTLSAGAMLLIALLGVAAALSGPRTRGTRTDLAMAQLQTAGTIGLFASSAMVWFAAFFLATGAIAWVSAIRHGRNEEDRWWVNSLRLSILLSSALLLAGLALMGPGRALMPMERLSDSLPTSAWVCLGGAIWIRAGLFPFHGWMLGMTQKLPMVLATPWLMAPVGVYMVARLGVAALHGPQGVAVLAILTLAAGQAVYGAILAFGAKSLRTMIGALALADTALAIVAIVEGDEHTLSGGLLMVLGNAVALTGMWSIAAAAASRTGSDHMRRLTGFAQRAPMLSMWFMVFAVAGFGLPGSPAFVATELVVHGSWQAHPGFAGLFIAVQALASVVLWRAWTISFLGTSASAHAVSPLLSVQVRNHPVDAMPRERWGALVLATVGLTVGILPAAALDFERPAVEHLLGGPIEAEHHPDETVGVESSPRAADPTDYGLEAGNPAGYTIVVVESAATASGENTIGISTPPSQLSN